MQFRQFFKRCIRPSTVGWVVIPNAAPFPERKANVDGGLSLQKRIRLYKVWHHHGSNAAFRACKQITGRNLQMQQMNGMMRHFEKNVLPGILKAASKADRKKNKKRKHGEAISA